MSLIRAAVVVLLAAFAAAHTTTFAPVLVWTNDDSRDAALLAPIVPDVKPVVRDSLILGHAAAETSVSQKTLEVVLLGTLDAASYRKLALSSKLANQLQTAAASSSATMMSADQVQQLVQSSKSASSSIGCTSDSISADTDLMTEFANALAALPDRVVVCFRQGAEQEAAQLQDVADIFKGLAESGLKYVVVYANNPPRVEMHAAAMRTLLADMPSNSTGKLCGELCKTQVRYLEGIIGLLVLIMAAISGLCCMNLLDTPTKFESPKEGQ